MKFTSHFANKNYFAATFLYNKILLRLEESEYQKQIGLMIQNEQNKIKEIDSLEIELTKMTFVAIKLEQQQQQQQQVLTKNNLQHKCTSSANLMKPQHNME